MHHISERGACASVPVPWHNGTVASPNLKGTAVGCRHLV